MKSNKKQLENLSRLISPNKVIVIYGPRRCGKTTLLNKFLEGIGEPLTGRKFVLKLFPLAQMEISRTEQRFETDANLESRLIYGSYKNWVWRLG